MNPADETIIRTLLDEVLSDEMLDKLQAKVLAGVRRKLGPADAKLSLQREVIDVENALARLASAIAARAGDDDPAARRTAPGLAAPVGSARSRERAGR